MLFTLKTIFSNQKFIEIFVKADLLCSTIRQTRYYQGIQMSKTLTATQISGLEKVRLPSLSQNQGTCHYILVQVICFSLILESTWKVNCSLQAWQHPKNKELEYLVTKSQEQKSFLYSAQTIDIRSLQRENIFHLIALLVHANVGVVFYITFCCDTKCE